VKRHVTKFLRTWEKLEDGNIQKQVRGQEILID